MKAILLMLSIGALVWALMVFMHVETSQSAIHEIEGLILLLIAAVLFVGASIMDAVSSLSAVPVTTPKFKKSEGGLAVEVETEIESGAVDQNLWQVAKHMARKPDEKSIREEYIKLRVKRLQELR